MGLAVLVNSGPWLRVPPEGYGGIENVVATLIPELRRRGHRVVLAGVGGSEIEADRHVSAFDEPQFEHLAGPYNRMAGIAHAHMQAVVAELRDGPPVDVVHDHLEVVGPSVLAAMGHDAPPALATLHWSLRKHPDFYRRFDGGGRVFFNGVSHDQVSHAPSNVRSQVIGVVPLSVPPGEAVIAPEKGRDLVCLARITADKGTAVAARLCRRMGLPLVIAGPVAGFAGPAALERALADPGDPAHGLADVRYYLDDVRPHVDGRLVRWIGSVSGAEKWRLLAESRAALFPIAWDEPGGTAVLEALASGTPVVAMRRGVMEELIEPGVNGLLADGEAEFAEQLERIEAIDPAACRRTVQQRFSAAAMAERYVALYEEAIARATQLANARTA